MYVDKSVFNSENDNEKEATGDAKRLHNHKKEPNISENKVQNSELGLDKEIVKGKKFL